MSDTSSEGGVGQKMTDLQRTLKGFAEPSEDSRSVDEKDPMFSSSGDASMTNNGKPGTQGRQAPRQAEAATGCITGAYNLVTKAMPKIGGNAGAGQSAASSSQGPQTILLPTSSSAASGRVALPTSGDQPMAADESSESGNTVF